MIGYLLLASTATCVASQLHVVVAWEDVATVQWKAAVADPNNPEQIISNGAVGADLGLWYFREFSAGWLAGWRLPRPWLLTRPQGNTPSRPLPCWSASGQPGLPLGRIPRRELTCPRAFALLQSIYGWKDKAHLKPLLKKVNDAGKGVSVTLPIVTICLLQVKTVQASTVGFIFLANAIRACAQCPLRARVLTEPPK